MQDWTKKIAISNAAQSSSKGGGGSIAGVAFAIPLLFIYFRQCYIYNFLFNYALKKGPLHVTLS